MFERENHFTYVFYWYNYVLFSIDLKKTHFDSFFIVTVPNSKVLFFTFIKSFRQFKLYSVSVCDEPCSPDRTYNTHTPLKNAKIITWKKNTKTRSVDA